MQNTEDIKNFVEEKTDEDHILDGYRDDESLKEFFRLPKHIQHTILHIAMDGIKADENKKRDALKKLIQRRKNERSKAKVRFGNEEWEWRT